MRLAAIDIGTLTCRLLVAEVNLPNEFKEIDADRRILRLGEGVDHHKRLSPDAMDRVVGTLKEWKERTAKYDLDALAIVATSAVRESENRQEFLTRVKQEAGWDFRHFGFRYWRRQHRMYSRSKRAISQSDIVRSWRRAIIGTSIPSRSSISPGPSGC